MSTKLAKMNRMIDNCPGSPRCVCVRLKCLVDSCKSNVAGHGYLVCGHHHDAYVRTGTVEGERLFLVVWAALQG